MATSPHLELELEKGGSPLTTTGPGELVAVLHKSYSTTNERIPKGEKPHCYNGPCGFFIFIFFKIVFCRNIFSIS